MRLGCVFFHFQLNRREAARFQVVPAEADFARIVEVPMKELRFCFLMIWVEIDFALYCKKIDN